MRMRFLAVVVALGAMIASATPAAAQDEFVAQRSAKFDLKAFGQGKVREGCIGEVWAGRTASGSIQATTKVRCSGNDFNRKLVKQSLATYLSIQPKGEMPKFWDWQSTCDACPSWTVAGSKPGGPGWCAFGLAGETVITDRTAHQNEGSAGVCV